MYGVFLGELLGERLPEGVEIGQGILYDLRAGRSTAGYSVSILTCTFVVRPIANVQEESCLRIFDCLGGFLLESTLRAGVSGFSEKPLLVFDA